MQQLMIDRWLKYTGGLLVLVLLWGAITPVQAASCVSNGSGGGDWNAAATWTSCAGGIPNDILDDARILAGDTVTLNITAAANRQVRDLVIEGQLDFTGGQLRVERLMNVTGTFAAGAGTQTAFNGNNSLKTLTGTGSIQFAGFVLATRQLTVDPGVTFSVSEDFVIRTNIQADPTSTAIFNGTGAQLWDLDTGPFDTMQMGNIVIDAGSDVTTAGAMLNRYRMGNDFEVNGTFDALNDEINFNTTNNNRISGTGSIRFADLTVQAGGATLSAGTTINVEGDLSFNSWTTDDNTGQIIFDGAATSNIIFTGDPAFPFYQVGSVQVTNNTIVNGPANAATRISGDLTVAGGSTFNANGSTLAFNEFPSGVKTISGTGTIDLNAVRFTPNSPGVTLASGTTVSISGDVEFGSPFTSADDGRVILDGTTQQLNGDYSDAQFGLLDIDVGTDVTTTMTNPFEMRISDNFWIFGTFTTDANTTLVFNGGAPQEIEVPFANGASVTDVVVTAGTTLIETISDDNITVNGTILNNGIIRKQTKAIPATGGYRVGLASGNLPAAEDFLTVNTIGTLTEIQVDFVGANHPNADTPQQTGSYREINPTGSGYDLDLTLPHNNLTAPSVCQYTGTGVLWDCVVDASTAASVSRAAVTDLAAPTNIWTVGAGAAADLVMTKSATLADDVGSDGNVDPGDTIQYAVTVTNNGPADVTGVVINDVLPAGVTYISDTTTEGTYDSVSGDWTGIALLATESATLTIDVTVAAGTEGQTISNSAAVTASSYPDPVAGNDSADAAFTVFTPPPPEPEPEPTPGPGATFDATLIKVGERSGVNQVIWTIAVTNTGNAAGQNVVISDTLPDNLQPEQVDAPGATVAINGQTVTIRYATLAAGNRLEVQILATVRSGSSVNNTACLNADNLAGERCATSGNLALVAELPSTGESPAWRSLLLWLLILPGTGLLSGLIIWRRTTRRLSSR